MGSGQWAVGSRQWAVRKRQKAMGILLLPTAHCGLPTHSEGDGHSLTADCPLPTADSFSYAASGSAAPPCSVKLTGALAGPSWPRALTQRALSQTVAPLAIEWGKSTCVFVRVVIPSK